MQYLRIAAELDAEAKPLDVLRARRREGEERRLIVHPVAVHIEMEVLDAGEIADRGGFAVDFQGVVERFRRPRAAIDRAANGDTIKPDGIVIRLARTLPAVDSVPDFDVLQADDVRRSVAVRSGAARDVAFDDALRSRFIAFDGDRVAVRAAAGTDDTARDTGRVTWRRDAIDLDLTQRHFVPRGIAGSR